MRQGSGLTERLTRLGSALEALPGVLGVSLGTQDGLPVWDSLPAEADPDRVVAMAAAVVGASERVAAFLDMGSFRHATVACARCSLVCLVCNSRLVLVLLVAQGADVAAILQGALEMAPRFSACFEEGFE